jgi:hypothetical protein
MIEQECNLAEVEAMLMMTLQLPALAVPSMKMPEWLTKLAHPLPALEILPNPFATWHAAESEPGADKEQQTSQIAELGPCTTEAKRRAAEAEQRAAEAERRAAEAESRAAEAERRAAEAERDARTEQSRVQRRATEAVEEALLCGICMERGRDACLSPCGHTACGACANQQVRAGTCFTCAAPARGCQRMFL